MIDFHPGLIYGFVGAYAALSTTKLDTRQHAVTILRATLILLAIIVAAFFLRVLIPDTAIEGQNFWLSVADGILVGVFVIGLEGLLFTLVPLTFMDGAKVTAWRRWVWLLVFALVAFLFYHIIINEDGRLTEAAGDMEVVMMFWLMGMFAVLSGATWVYFQWRRRALPEEGAGTQPLLVLPEKVEEEAQPPPEEEAEEQATVLPEEGEERDS